MSIAIAQQRYVCWLEVSAMNTSLVGLFRYSQIEMVDNALNLSQVAGTNAKYVILVVLFLLG